MGRVLIAALVGSIVYFAWGAISWMALPWHNNTMHTIDNEAAITAQLKEALTESGVYFFPGMPDDNSPEAWAQYTERHRQGPYGMMFYHAQGSEPMPPSTFAVGFALDFVNALVAAWLVFLTGRSAKGFIGRLGVVAALGIVAAVTSDLMAWNWMHQNTEFSLVNAADHVVSFILMGIPIACIVKPRVNT